MPAESKDRAVIFDLDGVLIDTGRYHKQSWYDLAAAEGWHFTDEFFYRTFGMQNSEIIPQIVGRPVPPDQLQRLSQWKESRYRELIAGNLQLMAGAGDLIADLKTAGFKLAIGSSAPRQNLEFMLANTGIRDCFNAVVTSEDVSRSKPEPDTFLKAADKLGLSAIQCVVVEDAVQGVQAARAAGMAVVAVTTTRSRQDLTEANVVVDGLVQLSAKDFEKLTTQVRVNKAGKGI